ncbi:MAG: helix-turn-helix domain-containing protein [Thermoguttaceae bacterium]|nr:helix-turn-helix domain-containing protein [Thermoguttaceae bacterium]
MSRVKEESILLSTPHAAELIGCSKQALRNWHLFGRVPVPTMIGNRLYWKRAELIQWIDAGCPNREEWKKYKQEFK